MYEDNIYSNQNLTNHTVDTANHTADTANHTVDSSNYTASSSNHTADTANHTVDSSNYTASSSNNTTDSANRTVDSANRTVDTAGYSAYRTDAFGNTSVSGGRSDKGSRKKKGSFLKKMMVSISLGLCFGLFAGFGFQVVQFGVRLLLPREEVREEEESKASYNLMAYPSNDGNTYTAGNISYVISSDISDVVEQAMPAMVTIVNSYVETGTTFWGQTYREPAESGGSGIIVAKNDEELLIVSNNHVVEGAETLTVTFIDGSEAKAVIKGLDSDMDLAVIAVPLNTLTDETKAAITIAPLGDSDKLKLGEPVIAIGNALGFGQSVTNGIVSALNREITLSDGSTGTFIQTNAAINRGNSGGALLNINGEVIGINSNKIGGGTVEGMGYAIPITAASPIISDLMERQTRMEVAEEEMGYLGISPQTITSQYSQLGIPQGVFVVSVEPESAAEQAGMVYGDIIVSFDGQKISTADDLRDTLKYYRAGETVTIKVQRMVNGEYQAQELDVTLGRRP